MIHSRLKLRVDISEIQKDIHYYISSHDCQKPEFLVMNLTTAQILADDCVYITDSRTDILASELYGIRVAVNNSLDDYIVKVVG